MSLPKCDLCEDCDAAVYWWVCIWAYTSKSMWPLSLDSFDSFLLDIGVYMVWSCLDENSAMHAHVYYADNTHQSDTKTRIRIHTQHAYIIIANSLWAASICRKMFIHEHTPHHHPRWIKVHMGPRLKQRGQTKHIQQRTYTCDRPIHCSYSYVSQSICQWGMCLSLEE